MKSVSDFRDGIWEERISRTSTESPMVPNLRWSSAVSEGEERRESSWMKESWVPDRERVLRVAAGPLPRWWIRERAEGNGIWESPISRVSNRLNWISGTRSANYIERLESRGVYPGP